MAFWNQVTIEPKRTFRYYVTFGGSLGTTLNSGQISMFATSVSRPKYEVSFKEFQYLNHQFNFPGRVKWQDITMKFVDAGGSGDPNSTKPEDTVLDIARMLMGAVVNGGYTVPSRSGAELQTLSKKAMNAQVGDVTIKVLTADATVANGTIPESAVVEEWKIYNAMFGNVSFSDLSYDNEDFSTIDLTIKYDYATISNGLIGGARAVIPTV